MKKRILSLLMTALLTVSLFPTAALAEGEETEPLPGIGFYTAQTGSEENRISGQYNYLEHREGQRVVWLVSDSGFSDGDGPTVSLAWDFTDPADAVWQTFNDSIEIPEGCVEKVARTGSNPVVYDYKFDLSCVKTALTKEFLSMRPETYLCRLTVQIDNQTATLEIAIPRYEPNGIPVGGGYILSTYNHFAMDNTTSPIYVSGSWANTSMPNSVYVGVLKPETIDGNTEYLVAPQREIQWTVNRVWMENIVGDGGTWSFNEAEKVAELQNPTLPVGFYGTAPGCYSLLLYEVTVTYGGSSSTYVLGFNMDSLNDVPPPKLERDDDDTVEALNEALQSIESDSVVTLGNTTYRGVIEVPEGKTINFQGGRKTIIEGGISAPDGWVIASLIHFRGTEDVTQAVTGRFSSTACSFTGYRVALGAGQDGLGNVFIGNEVAILVNDSGWPAYSTFIGNGTAVKIERLDDFYTPYRFRIYECNFIDNDVDFDVSVPGTFYFNRNYFGRLKHQGQGSTGWGEWSNLQQAITQTSVNAVIGRQKAKIQAGEGTRVVADAVYKYPVLYWWVFEASIEEVFGSGEATPTAYSMEDEPQYIYEPQYINVLTADWDTAVQMADDDEESMVIEAEAFEVETEGAKEISVMNESGSAVGTWSFGGGAQ